MTTATNLNTEQEIRNLLKAQYKLLYIQTWEEERCKTMLFDIVQEQRTLDMYVWTLTSGLVKLGDNPGSAQDLGPEEVLAHIKGSEGKALYLLKDFHSFLKDASVTRSLRDIVNEVNDPNQAYRPIVITSPVMQIPVELEKVVQVLDFDLPNAVQIGELIDAAQESIIVKRPDMVLDEDAHERLVKACQGLTVEEIENILAKSFVECGCLNVDIILNEKKQAIRKSGVLEYFDTLEEFADIGGMDSLKNWIAGRGRAFEDRAREFGLPQPKGVMLLGVQGCGKSALAKAIAGLWKMPLIRLDVGRVMAGIVGSSEENMRKAIRTAESIAPAILFVDEIEKGLSGTGSSNHSDGGTTDRVFSTLLTWLS